MRPRPSSSRSRVSEASEQIAVARELRRLRIVTRDACRAFAVPNGGSRQRTERALLAAQGVEPGVPDMLVVGRPRPGGVEPLTGEELAVLRDVLAAEPADSLLRRLLATVDARGGLALELKRCGGRQADLSDGQRDWLGFFGSLPGWQAVVGFGAEDALRKVAAAGYPVRGRGAEGAEGGEDAPSRPLPAP